MNRRIVLFALIILLPALFNLSCTKIDTPPDSAVVTAKWYWHEWARDNDKDGALKPSEIHNQDIYFIQFTFNTDGSGKYDDQNLPVVPFQWAFAPGNKIKIDFATAIPEFANTSNVHHIDSLGLHDLIISDTDNNGAWGYYYFRR